jgi:hypothetical protein
MRHCAVRKISDFSGPRSAAARAIAIEAKGLELGELHRLPETVCDLGDGVELGPPRPTADAAAVILTPSRVDFGRSSTREKTRVRDPCSVACDGAGLAAKARCAMPRDCVEDRPLSHLRSNRKSRCSHGSIARNEDTGGGGPRASLDGSKSKIRRRQVDTHLAAQGNQELRIGMPVASTT